MGIKALTIFAFVLVCLFVIAESNGKYRRYCKPKCRKYEVCKRTGHRYQYKYQCVCKRGYYWYRYRGYRSCKKYKRNTCYNRCNSGYGRGYNCHCRKYAYGKQCNDWRRYCHKRRG